MEFFVVYLANMAPDCWHIAFEACCKFVFFGLLMSVIGSVIFCTMYWWNFLMVIS